ncbi:hypothetical protein F7725_003855, partial [Dissostichus mawsoni]
MRIAVMRIAFMRIPVMRINRLHEDPRNENRRNENRRNEDRLHEDIRHEGRRNEDRRPSPIEKKAFPTRTKPFSIPSDSTAEAYLLSKLCGVLRVGPDVYGVHRTEQGGVRHASRRAEGQNDPSEEGPSHMVRPQTPQPSRRQELFKPASHSLSKHPSREWEETGESERDWHYGGSGYLSRAHSYTSLQRSGSPSADEGSSWKSNHNRSDQMQ